MAGIKFAIVDVKPAEPATPHTLYFVKTGSTVKSYISDKDGALHLQSSGGDDGIEPLLFAGIENG